MRGQPPGIVRRDLVKHWPATFVALDHDHARGPFEEQRPRQSARPRPDLDHRAAFERAGRPRDASRQIEIENEILPQSLVSR